MEAVSEICVGLKILERSDPGQIILTRLAFASRPTLWSRHFAVWKALSQQYPIVVASMVPKEGSVEAPSLAKSRLIFSLNQRLELPLDT
jgi:hypothetical protein